MPDSLNLNLDNPEHIWNELFSYNRKPEEFQIKIDSLPKKKVEVRASGKFYRYLTEQQIKTKKEKSHDLISTWIPLFNKVKSMFCSYNIYLHLFDKEGFVIDAPEKELYGIRCNAFSYVSELLHTRMPIELFIDSSLKDSNPENQKLELVFDISNSHHNAMVFPISGENGEPVGFVGVGNLYGSLPEQKKIIGYLAARTLEYKYKSMLLFRKYARSLIDGLPVPAILLDEDGHIVNANNHAIDLLGIEDENAFWGVHINDFLIQDFRLDLTRCGIKDLKEKFAMKSRDNQIIPCTLINNKLVVLPGSVKQHLLLLQTDQQTFIRRNKVLSDKVPKKDSAFNRIIGVSPAIKQIKATGERIARTSSNVLIEGESGTGKELLAEAIHLESGREGPFIPINCGAIPKELLQSELFGYEDGAFTGAKRGGKRGVFEIANGGTLFLDEIGEMPLDMQVSLLRVLQDKIVTRLGGSENRKVDVRVIAATNRNLRLEVEQGHFRQDLYYRLNVINFVIPPLRERKEDIPLIAQHILDSLCRELNITQPRISEPVMEILINYVWPGNVRELRNVLESTLLLNQGEEEITIDMLPAYLREDKILRKISGGTLDMIEKTVIINTLQEYKGNISKTAKALGISRPTLYRKIGKLENKYKSKTDKLKF